MKNLYLSNKQHLAALKRQRDRIAAGIPLVAYDDNSPGNKSMACSWGQCSEDREAWPTPELHLWPDQFIERGRIAPKYTHANQSCPFDARGPGKRHEMRSGCFYTCMVFKRRYPTPTREQALALYDARIAHLEKKAK